jgi:hypothetical protein
MFAYAKAKYAFTGMDTGDLRFDKDEVPPSPPWHLRFRFRFSLLFKMFELFLF